MSLKRSILRVFTFIVPIIFATFIVTFQSCDKKPPGSECEGDTCSIAYKPNIYFFPKEDIQIKLQLKFPLGGTILKSEPLYNAGWSVNIDATGLINNKYQFLFYESTQLDVWQYKTGWYIKKENLTTFFESNLSDYGFGNKEITDFTEYWIPKLTKSNYYIIYPQNKEIINKVISFSISKEADNILRLFYVIKESNKPSFEISEPEIKEFKKEGFYITEWGVIM